MPTARPRRPAREIQELPFRHNAKPQLGLEVFRLSDLYARAERGSLPHALDAPRRPDFHIIYVGLRGRGHHVVDFQTVPLGAGHVTIVARGRVQQFVPDRGLDAWMILVEPEQLGDVALSVLSPAWPEPVLELPPDERAEILALADQLATEHARPLDRVQPALLVALLRALLLRMERLQTAWTATGTASLAQFFTILDRDCTRTRSVAHYAKAAGISTRRLGELLVAHTGKSTKQVIDERVVLEHKRLLVHTELSVKELAARTGFDEPTNLVKFFRHHTGETPTVFRARHRLG